jgi:hypothetical protein
MNEAIAEGAKNRFERKKPMASAEPPVEAIEQAK